MNCERCQELIGDLLDGSINQQEQVLVDAHLSECFACVEVQQDLESILEFCQTQRGAYEPPANEHAIWLRIRNTIEAEHLVKPAAAPASPRPSIWTDWLNRSWQLSFPQLAAAITAIVVVVSLATAVGLRRFQGVESANSQLAINNDAGGYDLDKRKSQQQQTIKYWNARIEVNRARWNAQMRDTFDRNISVIDAAVSDSLRELNQNPHDEVSEEMLNAALNEKISLLKEFSEL